MDLSKQTNDSFASASVYFDADSTVSSSSAFKTLEALSDISNISAAGTHNSTLEAKSGIFKEQVQLKTKHKMNMSTTSPLYAKSKNILQEYRAQCSTPTHAQLMRTVDVKRGSEATLSMDLGMAFTNMEDDEKMPTLLTIEENKENALPEKESAEGSTLLTSSSQVDVITVIDRNKTTNSKGNEDETLDKIATEEMSNVEEITTTKEVRFKENIVENRNAPLKARRSLLPARIQRKSICEPDLKTNRPSRISLATTTTQRRIPAPKSIPLPLKTELPKSNAQINTRNSLLPGAAGEKRAFPYASRMSVVVKTTLNSPARKLMRRSVLPTKQIPPQWRRSEAKETATTMRRSMLPAKLKPINSAPKITVSQPEVAKKIEHEFVCTVCKAKYRIKSLFDAHKRSHEDGVPAFVRKANPHGSTNNMSGNNSAQCKYCDKKFALVRTLHIHLLQNCTKIPPTEKKKLQYTEMAHEGKPQLPTFTHAHSGQISSQSSSAGISKSNSTLNVTEFRANSKESAIIAKDLVNALSVLEISPPVNEEKAKQMAPPSSTLVKKKTAHMGVYRTPTKLVTCHICKLTFRDVLKYTHHTMTKHQSENADNSFNQME